MDQRTKTYWKNLLLYFLIIVGAVFILSLGAGGVDDSPKSLLGSYILVSAIAIIWLGHELAMKFFAKKK
jgi:hypothetical protein